MLGRSHISAAVIFNELYLLSLRNHLPISILTIHLLIGGGYSLLMDIDHSQSIISNSLSFISRTISIIIDRIFGHRGMIHSILGSILLITLFFLINTLYIGEIILDFLFLFIPLTTLFSINKFHFKYKNIYLVILLFIIIIYYFSNNKIKIPMINIHVDIMIGIISHLILDLFTQQGCRLMWPSKRYISFSSLKVGSKVERKLITPMFYFISIILYLYMIYNKYFYHK